MSCLTEHVYDERAEDHQPPPLGLVAHNGLVAGRRGLVGAIVVLTQLRVVLELSLVTVEPRDTAHARVLALIGRRQRQGSVVVAQHPSRIAAITIPVGVCS